MAVLATAGKDGHHDQWYHELGDGPSATHELPRGGRR
jgi:hypothetical protein